MLLPPVVKRKTNREQSSEEEDPSEIQRGGYTSNIHPPHREFTKLASAIFGIHHEDRLEPHAAMLRRGVRNKFPFLVHDNKRIMEFRSQLNA